MGLKDIKENPRDYIVFFVGLGLMLVFMGVCTWILGAINMCEDSGGILLGTMECELKSCIKDYDVYECGSGRYALRPQFNDTPWNLTAR